MTGALKIVCSSSRRRAVPRCVICVVGLLGLAFSSRAAVNVMLTGVPDYTWYAGCFGTASGNLMGYWDRHGFSNFYTGSAGGGVAPLDSDGDHYRIRSMWASKAGFDGRPANQPGHIDDYWTFFEDESFFSYEDTGPDPHVIAGRPEHSPDCLGDFIGLSQNKWTNMNGECDGNIDAFCFTFWDASGERRVNFIPPPQNGKPVRDIPSGLVEWTRFRGSESDVFSQLIDFNPAVSAGKGFTFEDMKAEIDAGYPVLIFLQRFDESYRSLPGMERANAYFHGMLAYGYYISSLGVPFVRYKTSWGSSGDSSLSKWAAEEWQAGLPVRGVIGYRPRPKITNMTPTPDSITIEWDGPSSVLRDLIESTSTALHWYVIEKSTTLAPESWIAVTEPSAQRKATVSNQDREKAFFRVKLLVSSPR